MNQLVARTINGLNRNTGFLILVAIVIFGFAILNFQKNNQILLQDTQATAQNTNDILRGQRDILCLLVVHAEESPDVVITQDIRDLCGDVFRPPMVITDLQPVAPSNGEVVAPTTPTEAPIIELTPEVDQPFCIFDLICLGN